MDGAPKKFKRLPRRPIICASPQNSRSCFFATPRGMKVTPHPHHLQSVGPPPSYLGHPLPTGEGWIMTFSLSLGERVAAMCRRVRGHFSEQQSEKAIKDEDAGISEPTARGRWCRSSAANIAVFPRKAQGFRRDELW
jgi:hypothetical protein